MLIVSTFGNTADIYAIVLHKPQKKMSHVVE